jgi:DNA polymerase elongation subunit (family B)
MHGSSTKFLWICVLVEVGEHEQVAELDFESLYPNIMRKYNLSAETIQCNFCCGHSYCKNENSPGGSKSPQPRVPELGYHICKRRMAKFQYL